jgi:hypothetical protein
MRRPWPTGGCRAKNKKGYFYNTLTRKINYMARYTIYDRIKKHIIRLLAWDRTGMQYECIQYGTLPSNEYGNKQSQTNFKMERKHSVLQMEKWRRTLKISVSQGKIILFFSCKNL